MFFLSLVIWEGIVIQQNSNLAASVANFFSFIFAILKGIDRPQDSNFIVPTGKIEIE